MDAASSNYFGFSFTGMDDDVGGRERSVRVRSEDRSERCAGGGSEAGICRGGAAFGFASRPITLAPRAEARDAAARPEALREGMETGVMGGCGVRAGR